MSKYRLLASSLAVLTLCLAARVDAARKGAAAPSSPAATQRPGPVKTLGPGDRLLINVAREPDLTKEYLIDDSGQITMSLLGAVSTQGLTPSQFQEALRVKLAKYVRAPEVYVSAFQRVAIAGGIQTPGVQDFP
ncbi:MAG: polysaccharide biosynthesis protein, partial [Armatimonadetes bacterium]|nr:polysaccharide biosynthesis protein [Armatimonadota bacterium]